MKKLFSWLVPLLALFWIGLVPANTVTLDTFYSASSPETIDLLMPDIGCMACNDQIGHYPVPPAYVDRHRDTDALVDSGVTVAEWSIASGRDPDWREFKSRPSPQYSLWRPGMKRPAVLTWREPGRRSYCAASHSMLV